MSPYTRLGDWTLYRRLFREARPLWKHLAALLVLGLLAAPLALLFPIPLQIVVDCVIGDEPAPDYLTNWLLTSWTQDGEALLYLCAVGLVVIAIVTLVRRYFYWVYYSWTSEHLVRNFRAKLLGHLQRLSLAFHQRNKTSDLLYRAQVDVYAIQSVVMEGMLTMMPLLAKVVLLLIVTAQIDATLVGIALLGAPVVFVLVEMFRRALRRRWRTAHESDSAALSIVSESLNAIRVVKAYGLESRQQAAHIEKNRSAINDQMGAVRARNALGFLMGMAAAIGGALVLVVGTRHVLQGKITLGELLMALTYLSQLYAPIRALGASVADLQSALARVSRVYDVFDEEPEILDAVHPKRLDRARGDVSLRDVRFGYGDGRHVLDAVSAEIPAGSCVGVAGRTGSGKSTLLSLLPRFYDPLSGSVSLDGVDIRSIALADLRRQFAIVQQDPVLFSGSIVDNIIVGDVHASREQVEDAARRASAHAFISAMPEGYDTQVGERGVKLSGGERQRVAIARAFLRDAPILILDEPTSALDVDTEREILGALKRLMEGRTTFIIAHRRSTLNSADRCLLVERGHVRVVKGPFDDVPLA